MTQRTRLKWTTLITLAAAIAACASPAPNPSETGDVAQVPPGSHQPVALVDASLETSVRAGLPTTGSASKVTSLRVLAPDELFYLRQQGNGQIPFGAGDFPRTQTARSRTSSTLRLTGPSTLISGLVVRITPAGGAEIRVTSAADGTVAGAGAGDPLGALIGGDPATPLTISVAAADNPGKPASGTTVDLAALTDVQLLQEYTFSYR